MEFELVVREGQQPGRTFTIGPGATMTIGRAPECDIQLPDPGVSRRHCAIEHAGGQLRVLDLDSANGTYINGSLVEGGPLRVGDQVAVGPTVLDCRAKGAPHPLGLKDATLAFTDTRGVTVLRKVVDTGNPERAVPDAPASEELKNLERAQRNLATAYQVSNLVASARSLGALFDGVIESIFQTINADRAALLLQRGGSGDELEIVAAHTRRAGRKPGQITVSRTVVRDVLQNAVSTLSQDASSDARYREGQSIIQQKIRSVMCAPIATGDKVLGVLYADSHSLAGAFSESDLELLALLGNQAGLGIHRVQLIAELEKFFFDTVRAIIATIDAKDGYTHRHSERVAAIAVRIARELGKGPEELQVIKLSGLLHDVGKIGVPGAILNKPGKLTHEEFEEVKKHPLYGVRILSHIKNPRIEAILPGVRHHHERWDGSGYPDGLAGHDIPFLGRLLAVPDVLDALRSDRPYRNAIRFEKTVEMITQEAGSHFDPEMVEAFAALHKRGELEVPAEWIEPDGDL